MWCGSHLGLVVLRLRSMRSASKVQGARAPFYMVFPVHWVFHEMRHPSSDGLAPSFHGVRIEVSFTECMRILLLEASNL